MSGAIYALASGAVAQKLRLENISNNLANAGTVGFKMDKISFRLPEEVAGNPFSSRDPGVHPTFLGSPIPITQQIDFTQGSRRATGNPLDLSLEGDGFFCVATDEGVRYTRNGSFTLSPEGMLTTHDGHPVLGTGGEITVDGSDVDVDQRGNIYADGDVAGTLRIVRFSDPQSLRKSGGTLFAAAREGSGEEETQEVAVQQGYLETSNVNAVKMMTEMIEVLRGYETYQKVIRTIDESTSRAIASVGSPE